MAHMYQRVVTIISKPAEERSQMEVEQILPWFRKKSELFRHLKPEVVKDIIKNCQFQCLDKDTVVIKQGDKGDRFYIILNGSVSIYINPVLSDGDNDAVKKQAEEQMTLATQQSVQEEENGIKEKKKLDLSKFGNYIGKIEAGKSFGELALINKDCVRNASIITNVPSDLLVVDRELYNRSLHAYQAQEYNQRSQFTAQYPLFSNWQPRYKKQMAMSLRKDTIPYEGTIVKQGDPVENIYFVLSGQAKLLIDPVLHQSQYPNYYPLENIDQLEQEEARTSIRKDSIKEKPKTLDKVIRTPSVIRRANHEKKLQRQLELCVIGAVEIIGDLEVIMELGTYTHTAICTQEAEILVLNLKNYERLIQKRNPKTIDAMRDIIETKLEVRCARLAERQVPLLRYFLYKLRCLTHPRKEPPSIWDKPASETSWKSKTVHRGPIIDMYGPGTVFHMIRMRDKQRRHAKSRARLLATGGRNRVDNRQAQKDEIVRKIQQTSVDIRVEDVDPDPGILSRGRTCMEFGQHHSVHDSWEEEFDYVTGDLALCNLEDKIQSWHSGFDTASKGTKRTVKLHRFNPEENMKPKPGKKVFIRKRQRRSVPLETQSEDNVNQDRLSIPQGVVQDRRCETTLHSGGTDINSCSLLETDGESEGSSGQATPRKQNRPTNQNASNHRQEKKTIQRQYTIEDYETLKNTLRLRQRTFGMEVSRISRASSVLS